MNSKKVKEIKKALECCRHSIKYGCGDCPYHGEDCVETLVFDMGDYINELETLCNKTYEDLTKEIDRLESENETLRNSKVVYETVDYCFEDLKKAEKRIAELEKENEILKGTKDRLTFADRIKLVDNAVERKLKQFAERLKEEIVSMKWAREDINEKLIKQGATIKAIDETLKEFIRDK